MLLASRAGACLEHRPTCTPAAIEAVALYHLEKISRESPKRLELGSKPVISSNAKGNLIFETIIRIATGASAATAQAYRVGITSSPVSSCRGSTPAGTTYDQFHGGKGGKRIGA
jgi:hypothetical protein